MQNKYLETPEKSENDKKNYRVIVLWNGLKVLLVSDPSPHPCDSSSESSCSSDDNSSSDTDESIESTDTEETSSSFESEEGDEKLAACALTVDVGSFSDPSDIQGLAHLLEHMIFMGSKKYPSENAFDSYIKKCGGFDNADTDSEETSFYFEIAEKYLDKAMDQFGQLFTEPLLRKESIIREREAVESEFQSKSVDDEVKRDQLLADLAQPGHPCQKFSWGNTKTLKDDIEDDELFCRMHDFRRRHYSAHRMFLCVQARLPLDTLEEMVIKNFSCIPHNNLPGIDFSNFSHVNAFKDEFYERVYFLRPSANICKLELTWCLPPVINQYYTKPHEYVAYLLGYEGKGSLCAYLRKKLWALDLVAGVDDSGFENNKIYALFRLSISLTEEGFRRLQDVIAVSFAYIKLLHEQGVSEKLYNELQRIEETSFRFQTEQSAFDNVQDLVLNLKYYPTKNILNGSALYFQYDENDILNVLNHIDTHRCNILIMSNIQYNGIEYDQKEKWFGSEFTSIIKQKDWIQTDNNRIFEFSLPEPNTYIADDVTLIWNDSLEPVQPYPLKILNNDVCEVWFKLDDKFLLPISYMYFYFMSPLPLSSAKNSVLLALFSMLLKYQLVEELYPATVAGLTYYCYPSEKGLVIKVCGYNEKMSCIVDVITKKMTNILENISSEQLNVFIKQQKHNYFNYFIKPKSLNKDVRLFIVESPRWSSIEKYNCLDEVTLEDMNSFTKAFLSELKVQILIQGNLSESQASAVSNSALQNIKCNQVQKLESLDIRTKNLPNGNFYVRCKSFNLGNSNSVITNFYQVGPSTIRTQCFLDLLIMIIEEPLFDKLRTKEQLGYDVSVSVRNNNNVLGYSITVNFQGNKYNADYVDEKIEASRYQMLTELRHMSIEDFEYVLDSLVKTKLVADDDLKDEVSRNWSEITCEEYIFDRFKREAECLKKFTKDIFLSFCSGIGLVEFKKLSVQVIGEESQQIINDPNKNETTAKYNLEYIDGSKEIGKVTEFINSLPIFPVVKTQID